MLTPDTIYTVWVAGREWDPDYASTTGQLFMTEREAERSIMLMADIYHDRNETFPYESATFSIVEYYCPPI